MVKPNKHTLRKWILFPCCLLLFGIFEEILYYKLELIANRYIRVGIMMFFYVGGISLIAYGITPVLEKLILRLFDGTRKGFGWLGATCFISALLLFIYYLWYQTFIYGPEILLPDAWRNPFLARFIK